jgi:2-amino-4-hydroxy-6-hydroxymethyldihydropteridine diphosphokinase
MVVSPSSNRLPVIPCDTATGVFIGLGSNLGHINLNSRELIERALTSLEESGDHIHAVSSFWKSKAWPANTGASDFTNAVCQIYPSDHDPMSLIERLHKIEAEFGRQRDPQNRWAERTMDLDLLDYNGLITENDSFLTLPHPRIAERDFVLLPLLEVCPNWVHPVTGIEGSILLSAIKNRDSNNNCRRLE